MNENTLLAAYGDVLEETDDPALFAVVGALEDAYLQVEPPAELRRRIRDAAIGAAQPAPAKLPAASWRKRVLRRPLTLVAAVLVLGTLAGGAGYAMKGLNLFSAPHLRGSCSGTTITIARPAYRIGSPAVFVRNGGTVYDQMLKSASHLQHPSYWVLPRGTVVVNTCRGVSVSDIEVGRDTGKNTELHAFSVVPFGQERQPTMVGSLLIPTGHGCAFRAAKAPVSSPDGRPVAQLDRMPGDLSKVSVLFPPCGIPTRLVPSVVPPSQEISFRIFGEVRYRGPAGSVIVLAIKPSPAAARPGLNLGSPAGTLPNGTRLYTLTQDVRWLDHGLVVDVWGDVPLSRLRELASQVVVAR